MIHDDVGGNSDDFDCGDDGDNDGDDNNIADNCDVDLASFFLRQRRPKLLIY